MSIPSQVMGYEFTDDLRQRLLTNLSDHSRIEVVDGGLKQAAVCLVICASGPDEAAHLLVTLRSSKLNRHSNQFALPGGRLDDGENIIEAALRETSEEIGLFLSDAAVLGVLDDFVTRSGYVISPVVAWGGCVETLSPAPAEVAEIFKIPLHELDGVKLPDMVADTASGKQVMSAVFPSIGHRMFAPTAALIYQLREVALHGRPTRVADLGQPEFTRG